MTARPIEARLRAVVALLDAHDDVLVARVASATTPAWCLARGWDGYLRGIDDATLERAEDLGPEHVIGDDAPPSLRDLAARVRSLSRLERAAPPASVAPVRKAGPKKRAQIAALAALAPQGRGRIVDLGAGRGHLTRELAATLGVPALGLERDGRVVDAARAIAPDPKVRFERRVVDEALEVGPDDLLVGLHACGALGDALIERAAASGAAVLLVSCCPQKIDADVRAPLSSAGRALARPLLGLANLARAAAAGTTPAEAARRRGARHALRVLLADAGVVVAPGEESRGVNRKQFRHGLAAVAGPAFARRGLARPSEAAIADAERRAAAEHAVIRRLALPRTMLARPLELAVVLDRAGALEAADAERAPRVLEAFDAAVSPRNLVIVRG